jgi:ABC-2 type transport system permease protein
VIRLLRSEVFKLRTVWSTWVLLGITAVLTAGLIALVAFVPHRRAVASDVFPAKGTVSWFDVLFSVMTLAVDLALILGAIMITGEHRHKTITPTFLAEPRRERMAAAKLIVALGGGLTVAVVAGVVGLIYGFAIVGAGIAPMGRMLSEYRHVWPGVAAAAVLFGAYGVGLGALLKNQVVTIVVALVALAVVEPIVTAADASVGRWLPGNAAEALESVAATARSGGAFGSGSSVHLLVWWGGALVIIGYGVVLTALGSLTTLRADVT